MADQENQLANAASEYRKTTVKIGDTTFKINKLMVMDSLDVLEDIREGMGQRLLDLENVSLQEAIVRAVIGAPRELVARIRDRLFEEVTFKNQSAKTHVTLAGSEEMAFENLSAVDVYEVLVRSLAVNFFDSFQELASRFTQSGLDSNQSQQSTSTRS